MRISILIKNNKLAFKSLLSLARKSKSAKFIQFEADDKILATAFHPEMQITLVLQGEITEQGTSIIPLDLIEKGLKTSILNIEDDVISFGEEPDGLFGKPNFTDVAFTQGTIDVKFYGNDTHLENGLGDGLNVNQALEITSALKNACKFLDKEEVKLKVNGVFFDAKNQTIASTDGFRLFTQKLSFKFADENALIPSEIIPFLTENLIGSSAYISKNYLNIQSPTSRYSVLLLQDQFPDYIKVLPQEKEMRELPLSIKAKQAIYETEKLIETNEIKIDLDDSDRMKLSSGSYEWIENRLEGKTKAVNFNINHLTQILALTDHVYYSTNKYFANSPFLFKRENVRIMLMPNKD